VEIKYKNRFARATYKGGMAIATRKTEPFTTRNRQFRVSKEMFWRSFRGHPRLEIDGFGVSNHVVWCTPRGHSRPEINNFGVRNSAKTPLRDPENGDF